MLYYNKILYTKSLIIWTLLSRQLVVATTTKPRLGHLALASEVAGSEDIPYHFNSGRPHPFKNCKVCLPSTSEARVRWPRISLVVATTRSKWLDPKSIYISIDSKNWPFQKLQLSWFVAFLDFLVPLRRKTTTWTTLVRGQKNEFHALEKCYGPHVSNFDQTRCLAGCEERWWPGGREVDGRRVIFFRHAPNWT
jgi:hypothetical protein